MLANKRQELILEQVKCFGEVTVQELSEALGVTTETIRRDINQLDKQEALKKVHGGAVCLAANRREGAYVQRQKLQTKEKQYIAKKAVMRIKSNDTIAIDTGATAEWVCAFLPNLAGLTVITSSLSALMILNERIAKGEINPTVVFLGGVLHAENQYTGGTITLELLRQFSIDICFASCTALCEKGAMMYDMYDSAFTKTMMQQSQSVVMLATSNKLETKALHHFCPLDAIDYIISDFNCAVSPTFADALQKSGVTLIY